MQSRSFISQASSESLTALGRRAIRGFLVFLIVGVVPGVGVAQTAKGRTESTDRYVDSTLGFAFAKPRFPHPTAPGATTIAVTLSAPTEGGFAPNVNVLVHDLDMSLDDYQLKQRQELQATGWQVIELKPGKSGGRPSLRTHARGRLNGREMEFLAITMKRDAKTLVVLTCTATAAQYPTYQAEFERVAASFVLEP